MFGEHTKSLSFRISVSITLLAAEIYTGGLMRYLTGENFLWAFGCILYGTLCVAAYLRGVSRLLPIFSLWIAEAFVESLLLFFFFRFTSASFYTEAYWTFAFLEAFLQVAVAIELADKALRNGRSWVKGTKIRLLLSAALSILLAVVVASKAHPAILYTRDFYFTRFELLTSLTMFLLAVSTLAIVYSCGSLWQRFYLYRFSGVLVWSAASSIVDTLHVYWRTASHFSILEDIHWMVSDGVVLYWIVTSFRPHQNRRGQGDTGQLGVLKYLYRSL